MIRCSNDHLSNVSSKRYLISGIRNKSFNGKETSVLDYTCLRKSCERYRCFIDYAVIVVRNDLTFSRAATVRSVSVCVSDRLPSERRIRLRYKKTVEEYRKRWRALVNKERGDRVQERKNESETRLDVWVL